jgi:hypothetical protein
MVSMLGLSAAKVGPVLNTSATTNMEKTVFVRFIGFKVLSLLLYICLVTYVKTLCYL